MPADTSQDRLRSRRPGPGRRARRRRPRAARWCRSTSSAAARRPPPALQPRWAMRRPLAWSIVGPRGQGLAQLRRSPRPWPRGRAPRSRREAPQPPRSPRLLVRRRCSTVAPLSRAPAAPPGRRPVTSSTRSRIPTTSSPSWTGAQPRASSARCGSEAGSSCRRARRSAARPGGRADGGAAPARTTPPAPARPLTSGLSGNASKRLTDEQLVAVRSVGAEVRRVRGPDHVVAVEQDGGRDQRSKAASLLVTGALRGTTGGCPARSRLYARAGHGRPPQRLRESCSGRPRSAPATTSDRRWPGPGFDAAPSGTTPAPGPWQRRTPTRAAHALDGNYSEGAFEQVTQGCEVPLGRGLVVRRGVGHRVAVPGPGVDLVGVPSPARSSASPSASTASGGIDRSPSAWP